MTPGETQIFGFPIYNPNVGFNLNPKDSEQKDNSGIFFDTLPSPVKSAIGKASENNVQKKKGLAEIYIRISKGEAKIAFCGEKVNPLAILTINGKERRILTTDDPIARLFKYNHKKEINSKNIDGLIRKYEQDENPNKPKIDIRKVCKDKIDLIKSGKLIYRFYNKSDKKAKQSKWHYMVKQERIAGTNLSGFVSVKKPEGFAEFAMFFKALAEKTGFMKGSLSKKKSVAYLKKYLRNRENARGIVDAEFFKDIRLTTGKAEDIYVSLGIFQRPDKEKPSFREYYFEAKDFCTRFLKKIKIGGETINLEENIKGKVVYVLNKKDLEDENIKKLTKAGIKVKVRPEKFGRKIKEKKTSSPVIYVTIKTNIQDPEDYNIQQAEKLLTQLLFSDAEWQKYEGKNKLYYLSLAHLIKISDPNFGIKVRLAIKKVNHRLAVEGDTSLDLKKAEREELRLKDKWLRAQVFSLCRANKHCQASPVQALKLGKLEFNLYYDIDRKNNKITNLSVKIKMSNGTERTVAPREAVLFIQDLLVQNGIPREQLGAPGKVNEQLLNYLSNFSSTEGDVIGGVLQKGKQTGTNKAEQSLKFQLSGMEEIDKALTDGLVIQTAAQLLVKKEKEDGTKEYYTFEEVKKHLKILEKIYKDYKPEELKKAILYLKFSNKDGKKIFEKIQKYLSGKFGYLDEYQYLYLSDKGKENYNKKLNKKINLILSFLSNVPQKAEFDKIKALFDKYSKKGVKPERLFYALMNSKHRVLSVSPNLIAFLENKAIETKESKRPKLDVAIRQLPIYNIAFVKAFFNTARATGLLLEYFLVKTKGVKGNDKAYQRLKEYFSKGTEHPLIYHDIAWFLEILSTFDSADVDLLGKLADKVSHDLSLNPAAFKNVEIVKFEQIANKQIVTKFYAIRSKKKVEAKKNIKAGSPLEKKTMKTDELYGEGRHIEVIWLDLKSRGKHTPGDDFLPDAKVSGDEQKAHVLSYITADGIRIIREEYGKVESRFKSDKTKNQNLPYIHIFSEFQHWVFTDLASYRDENESSTIPKASPWYAIIQKCKLWDASSNPTIHFDEKEMEFIREDRRNNYAKLKKLLERKAYLKGKDGKKKLVSQEKIDLILEIVKFTFQEDNLYRDFGSLPQSDIDILKKFEAYLKEGKFGKRHIDNDMLKAGELKDKKIPEEIREVYKRGCIILRRIALSAALALQVVPKEKISKDLSGSLPVQFGKIVLYVGEKALKKAFESVRQTMKPPRIVGGMGTDIWVLMAAKAHLFPEKVKELKIQLLRYAILNAFIDSTTYERVDYDKILEKLDKLKNTDPESAEIIGAFKQAVRSKDPVKIAALFIQPFYLSIYPAPKATYIFGKKDAEIAGLIANILSKKPVDKDVIKLRKEMFLALREYKIILNYLTNERVDREFLLRLVAEIKSDRPSSFRARFTSQVLGKQLMYFVQGNEFVDLNELPGMIEKFIWLKKKEGEPFKYWASLRASPNRKDKETKLKQFIAQYLQLKQPHELPSGGFSETSIVGDIPSAFGKYFKQTLRTAPPLNLGAYLKYLLFLEKGGMNSTEASFSALRMMDNLEGWNKMSGAQLKELAEKLRDKFKDMGVEGILLSLNHTALRKMLKKNPSVWVPGAKEVQFDQVFFKLLRERRLKIRYVSVKAQKEFEGAVMAGNRSKVIKMLEEAEAIINLNGISLNPWDKKYNLLRTDNKNLIIALANKIPKGKQVEITANGWIMEGSIISGLANLTSKYLPSVANWFGYNKSYQELNKVFNGAFALFFPSPEPVYSEETVILSPKEGEEARLRLALESTKDPSLAWRMYEGMSLGLAMMFSPISDARSILRMGFKNRDEFIEASKKLVKGQLKSMGFKDSLIHAVTDYAFFKWKYGFFMWFGVEYGIPMEIFNHKICGEDGCFTKFKIAGISIPVPTKETFVNAVSALSMSLIPLYIFPNWALVWYHDVADRFKRGDIWGALLEFWMVNTMAMQRAKYNMPDGTVRIQFSTWDRSFQFLDRLFRGAKAPFKGAVRRWVRRVRKNGFEGKSFWKITKQTYHEPSFFEELQRTRAEEVLGNRAGVKVGKAIVKGAVGGPALYLEKLFEKIEEFLQKKIEKSGLSQRWKRFLKFTARPYTLYEYIFSPNQALLKWIQSPANVERIIKKHLRKDGYDKKHGQAEYEAQAEKLAKEYVQYKNGQIPETQLSDDKKLLFEKVDARIKLIQLKAGLRHPLSPLYLVRALIKLPFKGLWEGLIWVGSKIPKVKNRAVFVPWGFRSFALHLASKAYAQGIEEFTEGETGKKISLDELLSNEETAYVRDRATNADKDMQKISKKFGRLVIKTLQKYGLSTQGQNLKNLGELLAEYYSAYKGNRAQFAMGLEQQPPQVREAITEICEGLDNLVKDRIDDKALLYKDLAERTAKAKASPPPIPRGEGPANPQTELVRTAQSVAESINMPQNIREGINSPADVERLFVEGSEYIGKKFGENFWEWYQSEKSADFRNSQRHQEFVEYLLEMEISQANPSFGEKAAKAGATIGVAALSFLAMEEILDIIGLENKAAHFALLIAGAHGIHTGTSPIVTLALSSQGRKELALFARSLGSSAYWQSRFGVDNFRQACWKGLRNTNWSQGLSNVVAGVGYALIASGIYNGILNWSGVSRDSWMRGKAAQYTVGMGVPAGVGLGGGAAIRALFGTSALETTGYVMSRVGWVAMILSAPSIIFSDYDNSVWQKASDTILAKRDKSGSLKYYPHWLLTRIPILRSGADFMVATMDDTGTTQEILNKEREAANARYDHAKKILIGMMAVYDGKSQGLDFFTKAETVYTQLAALSKGEGFSNYRPVLNAEEGFDPDSIDNDGTYSSDDLEYGDMIREKDAYQFLMRKLAKGEGITEKDIAALNKDYNIADASAFLRRVSIKIVQNNFAFLRTARVSPIYDTKTAELFESNGRLKAGNEKELAAWTIGRSKNYDAFVAKVLEDRKVMRVAALVAGKATPNKVDKQLGFVNPDGSINKQSQTYELYAERLKKQTPKFLARMAARATASEPRG